MLDASWVARASMGARGGGAMSVRWVRGSGGRCAACGSSAEACRRRPRVCSRGGGGDRAIRGQRARFHRKRNNIPPRVARANISVNALRMASRPQTLYEKIWNAHVVERRDDGTCLIYIDRHLVHEVTSPQAFEGLRTAGRKVRRPDLTLAEIGRAHV